MKSTDKKNKNKTKDRGSKTRHQEEHDGGRELSVQEEQELAKSR